jgi:hypothetical protein
MSISELYSAVEANSSTDLEVLKAKYLLGAINDWPYPVNSFKDFAQQLKTELRSDDLTLDNINRYNQTLNISKDAWKAESLSILLELINLFDGKDLNEILSYYENQLVN